MGVNNLKINIMTLLQFKRRLNACYESNEHNRDAWNLLEDLSYGQMGFNTIITGDNVKEYGCTLGNVGTMLDHMEVRYTINCCDSGMYICFQICR